MIEESSVLTSDVSVLKRLVFAAKISILVLLPQDIGIWLEVLDSNIIQRNQMQARFKLLLKTLLY